MTTWISRRAPDDVATASAAVDPALPLAGLRLAVKDNIDVEGMATTAGCAAFAYSPERSAPVVERLVAAGAVVVGKTNMDQFATGLVGTRSPYGVVQNPLVPGYVSGGSSSGSAVAVATGEADIALGTDTAGSGRVPAAFCGVVGLKPTPGWLSNTGTIPACASFDCVSVFALDVGTAARAVEVAAGPDPSDPRSRSAPAQAPGSAAAPRTVQRLGVPGRAVIERWCHPAVVEAFAAAVRGAEDAGFSVREVDLAAYFEAGELLYGGALVAERYAAVGPFVDAHPGEVDPTVAAIIGAARELPAHRLARDLDVLAGLRRRAAAVWHEVDAVLLPTAPSHPTIAEVAADPVGVNASLGRFTTGCNMVGWCAASVPVAPRSDGLPFGVTVLGPAWSDRAVWHAAASLAGQAPPVLGVAPAEATGDARQVLLAVCGAHLEGQPLNGDLTSRGAVLVERTTTAPAYRMVLLDTTPPKPGLARVGSGGAAIEVEVWALDPGAFGTFVDAVPAPLAIGTVELASGATVNGFLCEPHAFDDGKDITAFGGWRAWLDR